MGDESIPGGAGFQPPSHPSVFEPSIVLSHHIILHVPSPRPRTGSTQDQQVVRDHAESHPPLDPEDAPIAGSSEAVAPLQGADAPFAAGPPCQGGSNAAPAAFPTLPRQDHGVHPARVRGALVRPRGKACVGHRQARDSAEEVLVLDERRDPQGLVRHAPLADLVVGDELRLGPLRIRARVWASTRRTNCTGAREADRAGRGRVWLRSRFYPRARSSHAAARGDRGADDKRAIRWASRSGWTARARRFFIAFRWWRDPSGWWQKPLRWPEEAVKGGGGG